MESLSVKMSPCSQTKCLRVLSLLLSSPEVHNQLARCTVLEVGQNRFFGLQDDFVYTLFQQVLYMERLCTLPSGNGICAVYRLPLAASFDIGVGLEKFCLSRQLRILYVRSEDLEKDWTTF